MSEFEKWWDEAWAHLSPHNLAKAAWDASRAALQGEPVAWIYSLKGGDYKTLEFTTNDWGADFEENWTRQPLYAHPQDLSWLDSEEFNNVAYAYRTARIDGAAPFEAMKKYIRERMK